MTEDQCERDHEHCEHETKIAVLEERVKSLKENIDLQAKEYERRLTELNHAHAQSVEDKLKFVSGDTFYSNKDAVYKWQSGMDQWRSKVIGIAVGAGLAAGSLGGIITGLVIKALSAGG